MLKLYKKGMTQLALLGLVVIGILLYAMYSQGIFEKSSSVPASIAGKEEYKVHASIGSASNGTVLDEESNEIIWVLKSSDLHNDAVITVTGNLLLDRADANSDGTSTNGYPFVIKQQLYEYTNTSGHDVYAVDYDYSVGEYKSTLCGYTQAQSNSENGVVKSVKQGTQTTCALSIPVQQFEYLDSVSGKAVDTINIGKITVYAPAQGSNAGQLLKTINLQYLKE